MASKVETPDSNRDASPNANNYVCLRIGLAGNVRRIPQRRVKPGDLSLVEAEPPLGPYWSFVLELPSGDHEMQLVVWDDAGEPFCTGRRLLAVTSRGDVVADTVLACLDLPDRNTGQEPVPGAPPARRFVLVQGNVLCTAP